MPPRRITFPRRSPGAALLAAALLGCGSDLASPPNAAVVGQLHPIEWSGGVSHIVVLEPRSDAGPGPHPVVFALPWGAGDLDLVVGFLEAYWLNEPANRGYYVVGL